MRSSTFTVIRGKILSVGIRKLMVIAASTAPLESQGKEALAVSNNTRMHISVALAKMVDSFG